MEKLRHAAQLLEQATELQPCPACKQDMEVLGDLLRVKIEGNKPLDKKEAEMLRGIDYINEVTNVAIFSSKLAKPIVRLANVKAPKLYEDTLKSDMLANKKMLPILVKVYSNLLQIENRDADIERMTDVMKGSIKAVEFKIGLDAQLFYVFDSIVKFGYRTHLLDAAGKVIMLVKK